MSGRMRTYVRKAMGVQSSSPGEGRAAATEAVTIAGVAVGIGYAAPLVAGYYGRSAAVRLAISYGRKPMLTIAANHAKSGIVRAAARGGLGVSKVYGMAVLASTIANPFMSIKYAMRGDLKRAALAHYGPVGAVWLYNRREQRMERHDRGEIRSVGQPTNLPTRTPPSGKPKKIKRMSQKQKNRLWRMGLRWCPKHKRYDKCSLRAR
jgi:hypothetical protein